MAEQPFNTDFDYGPGGSGKQESAYRQTPGRELNQASQDRPEMAKNTREALPAAAGPSPEEEAKQKLESEMAAREREAAFENMATKGKTPGEVIYGMRKVLESRDESIIPSEVDDPWQVRRVFAAIFERRQKLDVPVENFETRGWIRDYNPNTGKANILDRRAAAFAISTEEKIGDWEVTKRSRVDGKLVEEETRQIVYEYNFGKKDAATGKDERKEMARICERAYLEIGARAITNSILGEMDTYRDALEALTEVLQRHKYKIPHLVAILNQPDENMVESDVEDHTEGDRVEKAMWWYLAMMASESKASMQDFIDRPATNALIMPDASDDERTRYLKTMLGKWDKWSDVNRNKKTLAKEVKDDLRGPITIWGNIPARGRGANNDFSYETEVEYVKLIGQLSGSESSSWMASSLLKSFAEFAINGVADFGDNDPVLELGTGIWLNGNDLGKLGNPDQFIQKERIKGRPSGPEKVINKIPRMALSFLDHAQVIVGYKDVKNKKGEIERVSESLPLRIFWLGDKARSVKDLAAIEEGKMVDLLAVPYTRLGAAKFGTFAREDFGSKKLLDWLAGRDKGIYNKVMNEEPTADDFKRSSLAKDRKFYGIGYNPVIALNGDMRGQDIGAVADKVSTQVMQDVYKARKGTQAFFVNVASQNDHVVDTRPNTGGDFDKAISREALADVNAEKLGMAEGSTFHPEDQFFDKIGEIRDLKRKGHYKKGVVK